MNLSYDQKITILENYANCNMYVSDKADILEVLQAINGRAQGLIDFYAYYFTANYSYELIDIIEFLAEECNIELKEFINTWLQE